MFLATGILSSDKVHLDLKNRFLFGVQFCTFVQAHKTSKMATPNSFLKTGGKVFIKGIQNFINFVPYATHTGGTKTSKQ